MDTQGFFAEGIAQKNYKQKEREGFAGPKGEPSAGCSVAQRNPQKPDPKGRAQIIQIKKLITKYRTKNNSNKKIAIEIRRI